MKNQKNSIRLTNKTARNLRKQAVTQKNALYAAAVIISIALTGVGFVLGMEHIIILPLMLLLALGMDLMIILLARGRYLSLSGQAICTEAAARQIKTDAAEQARMETARRDLERIKADLAMEKQDEPDDEADERDEEDDEDLFKPLPAQKKTIPYQDLPIEMMDTRALAPVQRRRRQARLQVLSGDTTENQAN